MDCSDHRELVRFGHPCVSHLPLVFAELLTSCMGSGCLSHRHGTLVGRLLRGCVLGVG